MNIRKDDPRLTAYVLNELSESEKNEIENAILRDPEIEKEVNELRQLTQGLYKAMESEEENLSLKSTKEEKLKSIWKKSDIKESIPIERAEKFVMSKWLIAGPVGLVAAAVVAVVIAPNLSQFKKVKTFKEEAEPQVLTEAPMNQPIFTANKDKERADAKPLVLEKSAKRDIQQPEPKMEIAREQVAQVAVDAEQRKQVPAKPVVISGLQSPISAKRGRLSKIANNMLPSSVRPYGSGTTEGAGFGTGADGFNTEGYDHISENEFLKVKDNPLSTFSIDVDTASYANVRRFLNQGRRPPKGAVRIEELINYFDYEYKAPKDGAFAVNVEVAQSPWTPKNKLVKIGIKGKDISFKDRPKSNMVFLLDVSGSMNSANKLPLLKKALSLLVENLGSSDRISIVVYAGAAGMVLEPTPGNQQGKILEALNRLEAGGSTNGGQGIQLAYKIAHENFIKGGVNRVILASDGDFNVGTTNRTELIELVKKNADKGVFLTILGFGMGNYKDGMMETLSNKGNGNYAYIDSEKEAKKVLVKEAGGTFLTIAKDVKLQLEFNPKKVGEYRLVGYENRMLKNEDFNDDKKDAGDIGAGHNVTAIYEIISPSDSGPSKVDPLKYQKMNESENGSGELLTVKIRYKHPEEKKSKKIEIPVKDSDSNFDSSSRDFKFSAAVAAFGMLLRDSKFKGKADYNKVLNWAQKGQSSKARVDRSEILDLIRKAKRFESK